MKKTLMLIVIIFMLVGCSSKLKQEDIEYVEDAGYFTISQGKILKKGEVLEKTYTLDLYIEPTSGASLKLYERLKESINILIDNKLVNVRINPLIYLNDKSNNNLSSEIGSHLLALAEYDPQQLIVFMDHVLQYDTINKYREQETYSLLNNLDLDEYEIKEIEKYASYFNRHLITGTKEYIEKVDYNFLELNVGGIVEPIAIDKFENAERVLIESIYKTLEKDRDKTELMKTIWPEYINALEVGAA